MISASHNPVQDNGIKIFSHSGYKLSDEQEHEIEFYLDNSDELPRPIADQFGRVQEFYRGAKQYVDYIESTISGRLNGLKVVLDCANGASSALAPQLFTELGAEVIAVSASPDGININEQFG